MRVRSKLGEKPQSRRRGDCAESPTEAEWRAESGKKKQHEPNLGQKEARQEKEKDSKLSHMGEMSDKSESKRR